LFLGLRLYTRIHITKTYAWDDTLMAIAMCLFLASQGLVFKGCQAGLGKRTKDTTIQGMIDGMMYIHLSYIFYIFVAAIIRVSIAMTLLRIVTARRYVYSIWASMFLNLGALLAALVCTIVECTPTNYVWNRFNPEVRGTCIPMITLTYISYVTSAASIVLDAIFFMIPCLVIWKLHLPRRVKIIAMATMSLGLFATIAIIIRLKYLILFASTTDYLFAVAVVAIWCIAEVGLALTTSCAMTLRPLMCRLHISVFQGSSAGDQPRGPTTLGQSFQIPDWPSTVKSEVNTNSQMSRGDRFGSEEEICGQTDITMTQDFELSESRKPSSA
ncbi:hypothetical protein DL98DRAFT_430161, partial [Cadophora sp. DSE1049]